MEATTREARYAEAIHGQPAARILTADGVVTDEVRAVMAVADEERVELQAEVEDEHFNHMTYFRKWQAESRRNDALVADLQELLGEWRGEAEWIESTFLPGPNSDTAARSLREHASDLRAVLDKHAG